jgi:integrase
MEAMSRRGKGEGSIVRRKDGRYQASYVGNDGRRHYFGAPTRGEVARKLTEALHNKRMGIGVAGPAQTVGQFLPAWLDDASQRLKPRTVERYSGLIRIHVLPVLGDLRLGKLNPQHLTALYASLRAAGAARASIAQLHWVLHSALDKAVLWQLVTRNVADRADAPEPQSHQMIVLTLDQSRTIIEATAGTEIGTLYLMALHTGMRQGEMLGLRRMDVDTETQMVDVNATLSRIDGKWQRGSPKSKAGIRRIRMTSTLANTLTRHFTWQGERHLALGHRIGPETLIFTDAWGEPINGFHVTERMFKPLLRRLGLPEVRFHDLRHAFASMMLSNGERVDLVSRMLGHSKPSITLNVYAHLMPGDQEEAVSRLDRMLGGAG